MNPVLRDILDLLNVERIEENLYRGRNNPEAAHVFGGQVLAQAIGAATKQAQATTQPKALEIIPGPSTVMPLTVVL